MEQIASLAGYVIVVVTFVLVCRGISSGWLAPNRVIGVRTSQTMKSEEAWNLAHRHFLPYAVTVIVVAAAFSIIICTLTFLDFSNKYFGLIIISGYVLIAVITIVGGLRSHCIAKEYNTQEILNI